jgi:methionine--tRNA ligase beta chain
MEVDMVTFEDFKKLDLRVCKITSAEEIKESKKMIKLIVDTGEGNKTLLAAIKNVYSCEELVGKLIVVIVNLEPKQIMGIMSEGMLLAANDNGRPILISPISEVPTGTKVE